VVTEDERIRPNVSFASSRNANTVLRIVSLQVGKESEWAF